MFLLFQTIDFPQRFFETPTLVTTTKHLKDDVNSRIDADNNAITEWIEVRINKTLLAYFLRQHRSVEFFFVFKRTNIQQTRVSNSHQNLDHRTKSFIKG